ncbi:penicillin-binding transpeptidase domain-containing protein [Corynebacterium sp. P7202]|uniref:Penicillin-binding transpeptidase domain-containing protein n=1 Tax=Corynebacterium pygosceleis TaxID=2800406 RepID=A0A9Q4C6V5_9CORY|nr:penicillin-binding transpeptidase domain-containing protein [Corynebacterium pygosceleis]MCK7636779.1 penicillin-binding transpeptidase domain-containing protein [Corynebacterium pygosceleis]MCX7467532.1 penicillin-binding transpeptidase domain-containing protein [Corynebacterium pygosceleis]
MKKTSTLLTVIMMVAVGLVGCTPKPPPVDGAVEDFFAAVSEGDFDAAGALTDDPVSAADMLRESFEGLQAEGIGVELDELSTGENTATAGFIVDWSLPRDRELRYPSRMSLSRVGGEWLIRWRPNLLHPRLGANQHLELRAINAERARVISGDGVALLEPGTTYRVLVNAKGLKDPDATARTVARALDAAHSRDRSVSTVNANELADNLRRATGMYSVGLVNEIEGPKVVEALDGVDAVTVNPEAAMVRTDRDFAPDIISRVERIVNDDLDGERGWQVAIVNAYGAQIDTLETHAPTPAPAVRVSLDTRVQRAAQAAVDLRGEMKAMMVVMRPSTGEVLAIAQTAEADRDGSVALMGQYPPGSTFKIITATAGMMDEGLTPDSIVPCPGAMEIGHRIVNNYNGFSLGSVPLERAFAASCNTSFADISARLEPGELQDVGKRFGLGLDYTIEGLGTVTGSVPRGEELVDRTEAGFGQGRDLASPFGMALVASTAATGHTPVPVLINGHETTVSEQVDPPSPAAIEGLQRMMRQVVTTGTARGMRAGGAIHGKTGEAEIAGGSHAWFAGFRDDDIAFATLVVLGGGSETSVAITDHFFRALDDPSLLPPRDAARPRAREEEETPLPEEAPAPVAPEAPTPGGSDVAAVPPPYL